MQKVCEKWFFYMMRKSLEWRFKAWCTLLGDPLSSPDNDAQQLLKTAWHRYVNWPLKSAVVQTELLVTCCASSPGLLSVSKESSSYLT